METSTSVQPSLEFGICSNHRNNKLSQNSRFSPTARFCFLRTNLSSSFSLYSWSNIDPWERKTHSRVSAVRSRNHQFKWRCSLNTAASFVDATCVKNATSSFMRSFNLLRGNPLAIKLASAVGVVIFAIWGLRPLLRHSRNIFLGKCDSSWKRSSTYHVTTSYIQPLLLWAGAIFICRALDPIRLSSEAGQIVKQRLLNFVRSLSTVVAFAHCFSSVIRQAQKFFLETNGATDTSNMGFDFAGRAVYTAVWVAAVSLFMELLGFSTQRWLTAGGLGTVLLTLAGREIFTNFLSSVMIHATRPFVLNEWIQTKIQGYEVSGTVEHVGWWSPTIIRGDDREAVHIPNHKFTVNVVRNLSQKTHWRIKTHLAISHLDVGKINNIVADMRKVLAKNPQVEQKKLHRRVFLENINPENQALLILVSCFVKTSRFEEYLCVKEAILLDLLRVISHHRARLATPIRTVQKIFSSDADLDSAPFSDSIFTWGATSDLPLLLIEPPYNINGEDKTKTQAQSARINRDDDDSKATPQSTQSTPDSKVDAKGDTNLKDTQQPVAQAPVARPSLEENIVLGVALEGSKRTLPIEEDIVPTSNPEDTKELAPSRSGNGPIATEKENCDTKRSSDQQDS